MSVFDNVGAIGSKAKIVKIKAIAIEDITPNLGITDCSICFCNQIDCAGEIFRF